MSEIRYNLSELATPGQLKWLEEITTKIATCNNDEIIIHVDFASNADNNIFYTFIRDVHTVRGINKNKNLLIENHTLLSAKRGCSCTPLEFEAIQRLQPLTSALETCREKNKKLKQALVNIESELDKPLEMPPAHLYLQSYYLL